MQTSNTYLPLIVMANELHLDKVTAKTLVDNLSSAGINKESYAKSYMSVSNLLYARCLFEKLIIEIDLDRFENPFIEASKPFYTSEEKKIINKASFNLSLIQIDDIKPLYLEEEHNDNYLVDEKLLAFDELLQQIAYYLDINSLKLEDIVIHNTDLKEQNTDFKNNP